MQTSHSPLGVCIFAKAAPNRVHLGQSASYLAEILAHAGVPYRALETQQLETALTDELKVLVTTGETTLEAPVRGALQSWIERGGFWISLGGLCELQAVHGATGVPIAGITLPVLYPQSTLGEGYLKPSQSHPLLDHLEIPLHFYNGIRLRVESESTRVLAYILDAHGRATQAPALLENEFGRGHCVLLAPDAIGAVVRIQQGTTVVTDGIPAPDGSAPVTDGVLKCDDGLALDWHFDRQPIEGAGGWQAFLQPIADQWRELILRAIFYGCEKAEVALPVLWLYPRNLPAMAHLSHDSDGNDLRCGEGLLEVMKRAEIHSTWCIIAPGYPRDFIEKVKDAGHELATHYDALDHPWSEAEFAAQCSDLRDLFGQTPVSNKSHYTRWEGGAEFFDWCARQNLELDQTKGPSKPGEIGFPFGSAQLYFPLSDDGTIHSVLEMPLHSQDLVVVSPLQSVAPLLDAVEKHHGILHWLFHPSHIFTGGVADALLDVVHQAKARGLEWWTARQFNDWERARRAVSWQQIEAGAAPKVRLTPLGQATVLVLGRHEQIEVNGQKSAAQNTTRWGFEFSFVELE